MSGSAHLPTGPQRLVLASPPDSDERLLRRIADAGKKRLG
jgi:hypothetical protein